jgi:hypothetical protein
LIVRLLREPLLQFLALGAMLFALYGLTGKRSAEAPEKIVVSAERVANLGDGFARTWRRLPNQQELQGLIEDYIRDEVFYREGRAAGLDRDDVIIRRRVRQKMEFVADEMSVPEPSDEQLAAYLASNPERFRAEDQLTFHQVFLSATRRANTIDSDSKQVASILARAGAAADATELGDPFLLGDEFRDVSPSKVTSIFGESFAKHISVMERGSWQGPFLRASGSISSSSANGSWETCRRSMPSGRSSSASGRTRAVWRPNKSFMPRFGAATKSWSRSPRQKRRRPPADESLPLDLCCCRGAAGATRTLG